MKKLISLFITSIVAVSIVGCASSSAQQTQTTPEVQQEATSNATTKPETVTITDFNGEITVPFDPARVAVLDLAALDIVDSIGMGDRVVGMPKKSAVSYLQKYVDDENVAHLGSAKEIDMEALVATEPDLIIIGGRLAAEYDNLSKIAPVVYLKLDHEIGYINSASKNVKTMATVFGVEELVENLLADQNQKIATLAEAAKGKTAIVGVVTSSSLSTLGKNSRGSLICNEIGFENLAVDVDSTHGDSASFELLLDKNPDYIFIIDRDYAISAEGSKTAQEVIENEIVMKTDAYKNGNIVYLTPDAWYLSEGGVQATNVMISDLEAGILK